MTEELSPADRSSIAAERGPVNMAVGGLLVFDAEPPLTRALVAERLAERIHLIPRLRQRLEEPPLGLANPVWTDDTGFDLDWHVRQASLPAPGGDAELGGARRPRVLASPRPLAAAVGGDGDRGARRRAHGAADEGPPRAGRRDGGDRPGRAGPRPERASRSRSRPPSGDWEPRRYDRRRHVARLASRPLSLRPAADGRQHAARPGSRSRAAPPAELRRTTELALELARTRPSAPMTPLNRPISPNRRFALATGDLAAGQARRARRRRRPSTTRCSRWWPACCGALPGGGRTPAATRRQPAPVALVPVSVRAAPAEGETGNRISTVFVDLPVARARPDRADPRRSRPRPGRSRTRRRPRRRADGRAPRAGRRRWSPGCWPGRWARSAPSTSSSPTSPAPSSRST